MVAVTKDIHWKNITGDCMSWVMYFVGCWCVCICDLTDVVISPCLLQTGCSFSWSLHGFMLKVLSPFISVIKEAVMLLIYCVLSFVSSTSLCLINFTAFGRSYKCNNIQSKSCTKILMLIYRLRTTRKTELLDDYLSVVDKLPVNWLNMLHRADQPWLLQLLLWGIFSAVWCEWIV